MQSISKNELYFFNNLYDDHIIRQALIDNRKTNFYKCLRRQEILQKFDIVTGKMSDFTIDESVNSLLGIPRGSYTLHLKKSIVPYYTKKAFLDKFKYYQPLSITQLIQNPAIFSNTIIFQVGNTFCFGMMVAESNDGCYIILTNNRTTGITKEGMKNYIENDYRWFVNFQNHADAYYLYKNRLLVFTDMIDPETGLYLIPLSIFTNLIKLNKPKIQNEWAMYIGSTPYDENIMLGTTKASIISKDSVEYVAIDKEFIEYIKNNVSNAKIYLINQYQKYGHCEISTNESNVVKFELPYFNNPIHPENIHVYAYDSINRIRFQAIEFDYIQEHPSIFELTLKNYEDNGLPNTIWIEWYESLNTLTKYDNAIQSVIDYCTDNNATYLTYKNEGKLGDKVSEYEPYHLSSYDYRAFLAYDEYPDIRSFRLNRLIETLKENPNRYKYLQKILNAKNKKTIRHEYLQSKSPEVFSRSLMSNIGEVIDPNDEYKFSEPMLYFKVHLGENIKPSALVYVNGVRVNIEYSHVIKRDAYFYIKRTHLIDNIDNLIDVEVYIIDSSLMHKQESDLTFYATDVPYLLMNDDVFGMIDINNVMVYDKQTKAVLKPGEVTYRYSLSKVEITPPTGEIIDFCFIDEDDYDFFLTSDEEFFVDNIANYLTVRKENQIEDVPVSCHKPLDMTRMYAILHTVHRINKTMSVTNINNYRKVYTKDASLSDGILVMKNFKESPDYTRFRIYYGGRLLNETEYVLSIPAKYGGDVNVKLNNMLSTDSNRELILEYLPVNETIIFEGTPDTELYHDELFWFNDLEQILLPDMMRVFINGKRIPVSSVKDIGAINIFKIDGYKDGDYIQIFIPAMDRFCYNLLESERIINDEISLNEIFRNFMKSK